MTAAGVLAFLVGIYFLPTIVAALRGLPGWPAIAVTNTLFGFTFVGWFVVLGMALARRPAPAVVQPIYQFIVLPPNAHVDQAEVVEAYGREVGRG